MTKKKEEGLSLDDAFSDDEDVEYAKPKIKKINTKNKEQSFPSSDDTFELKIKASKPISRIKKGDKIKVDSLNLEVDAQYVLLDHGTTKEMVIECFDPKTDKDYQIRYFSDQIETSMQFYELDEIIYREKEVKMIEW